MKKLFLLLFLISIYAFTRAQTNNQHIWVNGYTRSDGTYVRGHWKTSSNETVNDNFSTIGNRNPYTGKPGWISRDVSTYYYDSNLGRSIPQNYVYESKKILRLEIINQLNIYTNKLKEAYGDEFTVANIYWTSVDGYLVTRLKMNVFKDDEEALALRNLALYFSGLEALFNISGYLNIIKDSEFKGIKVNTTHYKFSIPIQKIVESIEELKRE